MLYFKVGDELLRQDIAFTRTNTAEPFSDGQIESKKAEIEERMRAAGGAW